MTSKRQMAASFAQSGLVWLLVGAWALLLMASGSSIPPGFVKPASLILSLLTVLLFVFEHWAWRWRGLNWLVQRPDLHGTWKGTLRSNYVDPEMNEQVGPREVFLVIHQTRTDLYLRLLTSESTSVTMAAAIVNEPDGRHTIAAVYRNESKIELRERSPLHRGGMHLHVGGQTGGRLEGEYWTDRGTNGSLELALVSRVEARDLESARELAGGTQASLPD